MSELPRGWAEATLEDLCSFENGDRGKNYSGRSTFVASGVPFISAGHLNNGHIDWDEMNYIPQANYDRLRSGKVKSGDFLFCLRGSLGKHAFVPKIDAAAIASSLVIVRPSHLIDSRFVDYYFRSPLVKSSIEVYSNGVAQPNLSSANLGRFEFPLPPLAEQKRIVAKLDALNAKSARARTELARIETLVSRYKQAVLSKAFSGELTSAEVSNWASCTLGDLALDVRYGTAEKCTYAPDLTPVLRIPNVANGRIDLSDLKHALFNEKELRKLALVEGDLLVIRSNGSLDLVGRSAVVDSAVAGMLFAGYLIRIRLDLSKALPPFIQYWMQSFAVRRTIEDAAKSTSGVNNVNSQQLQALQLQLPTLEEQHEIVRRIESAFAKTDRLAGEAKRALELVGRLDEVILAKAFRGNLVPQDENDEPAEHLLARIRAERETAPKGKRFQRKDSTVEKSIHNRSASEMNKSRQDVEPNHLTQLLRSAGGRKMASELWLQSGMDLDEFYKQLRTEIHLGQIAEGSEKGELVLANEN